MNILDIFKKRKSNGQGELSSDVANSVSSGITPIPNQPMPIAPDGVTAVRPRIVPNMPVNEDTGYSESAPMNVYPTPSQTTQDEINNIQTKDYSIQKDANGNIIHRGKDRDAKWSLKDKIGSTLLGVLSGAAGGPIGMLAGGLNAGMDRNYLEKRGDSQELNRLIPRLKEQQQFENQQADLQGQQAQNQYYQVKPQLEQQKIQNQSQNQQNILDLKKRTQDFKEADRTEYYRLEREKQDALNNNRSDLYDLAVRRQMEIERNNKENNSLRKDSNDIKRGTLNLRNSTEQNRNVDRASRLKIALSKQNISRAQLAVKLKGMVSSGQMTQQEADAALQDASQ